MKLEHHGHPADEDLERYALLSLSEDDSAWIEEHLLLCEACRQRLTATDNFIAGLRAAKYTEQPRRLRWGTRIAWGIAAGIVLIAGIGLLRRSPAPVAIALQTTRDAQAAHAPAGAPLVLRPDVTGLESASYLVEVVEMSGNSVWSGTMPSIGSVDVPGLKRGNYFVRLFTPGRQLLREFGLRVDSPGE